MRSEEEIFAELSSLCKSPGYIHALAFICFSNNFIKNNDKLTDKNVLDQQFSKEHLVRNEISTLLGLIIQSDINIEIPFSDNIQQYIDQTFKLLEEFHSNLSKSFKIDVRSNTQKNINPFKSGEALREAIFYCGESAYPFQYREFSQLKYDLDNKWLIDNKNFSIQEAKTVVQAIENIQERKIHSIIYALKSNPLKEWTILPGFIFTTNDVVESTNIDEDKIKKILDAFSIKFNSNNNFQTINDFNEVRAYPIFKINVSEYILFQIFDLYEALYDSPFYWTIKDDSYKEKALTNRGNFTEEFCYKKFESIFGEKNVYKNVKIKNGKNERSEIDILALFSDQAIIVQAKSKKLTLEARKGNSQLIKEDFTKSIQESYDQGFLCAQSLTDSECKFITSNGEEIYPSKNLKEIYIMCVISDHYPSLSFQTSQFLNFQENEHIKPPFVLDIFTLDVMSEFLDSPLYFISYVSRRISYIGDLYINHEIVCLAYHLQYNLWLRNKRVFLHINDDISIPLNLAFKARRDNWDADQNVDGILTRFKSTPIGIILEKIKYNKNNKIFEFGLFLLELDEETILEINEKINQIIKLLKQDGKNHQCHIVFESNQPGITFTCNYYPESFAYLKIKKVCEYNKNRCHAQKWFGISIDPKALNIKCCVILKGPITSTPLINPKRFNSANIPSNNKIGRNDACPCGSGKKYKKCCLGS